VKTNLELNFFRQILRILFDKFPITWIRNFAQRKDFPQQNPVGPDIRLAGKDAIRQGLDGHPFDWQ
jgi:hypothetical protein